MDQTTELGEQPRRDYVHLVEEGDAPTPDFVFGELFKYPEKRVGNIGMASVQTNRLPDDEVDDLTGIMTSLLSRDGLEIVPANDVRQNLSLELEIDNPMIGIRNADCYVFISLDGITDILKAKLNNSQERAADMYESIGLKDRAEEIRRNSKTYLYPSMWRPVDSSRTYDELNAELKLDSDPKLLSDLFFRFEVIQNRGGETQQ